MQCCVLSHITRKTKVMGTRNFVWDFCSHSFRHITSEKSFSVHSPTAKFSLSCLIQHRCLHHGSRALLVAAASQSQLREEKSGEVSWRRVRCLAFVTLLQRCLCVFLFSFTEAPTLQKVETALLQEALWTNGSATRRSKKHVLVCEKHIVFHVVFFWTPFPRQSR